jgi:uncharacterized protein (TIGR00290 family)
MSIPKALVAWSSGKDAAWALHVVRARGELDVVGLLTTVTEPFDRVSMHAVRRTLLHRQAAAAGLPVREVRIPWPCTNGRYEAEMAASIAVARAEGVSRIVFGDLFLADVRAYRERQLAGTGLEPVFPLWGRDTAALAREMIDGGLDAILTCVDPRCVDRALAGRRFDAALLAALPAGVDPCGENGEFHTFACAGPMFDAPLEVAVGEVVEREGFVFADADLAASPGERA